MAQFLTIIVALAIIDFSLFGLLAYIFKLYPAYRHLLDDGVVITDDTCNLFSSWNGDRYRSLILTKKHLIIKNSFFTSVKNIDMYSIQVCSVKNKRKNKSKITILFDDDDTESKLVFKSDQTESWISAFRKLGIEVEMSLER